MWFRNKLSSLAEVSLYNIMITCPAREPARNNGWGHFRDQAGHLWCRILSLPPGSTFLTKKNWTWYVRPVVQVNKPQQYCTLEINFWWWWWWWRWWSHARNTSCLIILPKLIFRPLRFTTFTVAATTTTPAPSIVWCYVNVTSSVLLHIPVQIHDSLVSMFTGAHRSTWFPYFFESLSYTDWIVLCWALALKQSSVVRSSFCIHSGWCLRF